MIYYSIIIPVFNAGNSLEVCVESILKQSLNEFEIILVDDGSTDNSPDICDKYANIDSRIRVIHQDNQGASSARNRGIEEAKGEWISFVDADDTVYPNYLSEFDKVEQKADLTYFGSHFCTVDGHEADYFLPNKQYVGRKAIEEGILGLKVNAVNYCHYGYTWNKFFKASIIKKHNIRFTPGIYFREDEIFVNDYVAHIDSLATMPYIGYVYFYTRNGLSWRAKTPEYWRLYFEKSRDFLLSISNEELQRYEYSKVMNACFRAFENEQNNKKYLAMLDEMLVLVKRFGYLYPRVGGSDYFSSILDYDKDKTAKHRVDFLLTKKKMKIMFGF